MSMSMETTGEATRVNAWRRGEMPDEVRETATAVPMAAGPDAAADLESVRRLARLLDSEFEVGGIRFGLDAIIGLIPVVGDVVSLGLAMYPQYIARRHKVGWLTRARMLGNSATDFGVGLIPFIGDIVDVGFKANLKNLKLLEKALEKKGAPGVISTTTATELR